jgi:hypothetical protein
MGKMGVAAVGLLGATRGLFNRLVGTPATVSGTQADERRHHSS